MAMVGAVARVVRRGQAVEGRPPQRRRADDQQHLLGREEHRPEVLGQRCRPARHAVDLDLLAAARLQGQLEATERSAGAARPRPPRPAGSGRIADRRCLRRRTDHALDAQEVGAPADQLRVGGGPVGPAQRQQDDGLEQSRLAGGVRAPDELRPGPELEVQRGVAPEIPDRPGAEERRRPAVASDRAASGPEI